SVACRLLPLPRTSAHSPLSLHDALPIFIGHRPSNHLRTLPESKRVGGIRNEIQETQLPGMRGGLLQRIHPCTSQIRRKPLLQAVDRKSTRLNSSHVSTSYAVFCLKKTTT